MRTLITGAKGQVGQALADTQPGGVECRWMGHTDLDLADARRMRQVISQFRPDVVINAAAYTAVDKAESEEGMAQVVNAEGPRVIAEAIAGTHCRLLHISTDFVFDGRASLPYRPDAPANPLSAYGRTKLAGERSAMAAGWPSAAQ